MTFGSRMGTVAFLVVLAVGGPVPNPTLAAGTVGAAGTQAPASAAERRFGSDGAQLVVKVDRAAGHTIAEVTEAFPVTVTGALLPTRGIYFLRADDPATAADEKRTAKLGKRIAGSPGVLYAESNASTAIADSRYHSWPEGVPAPAGSTSGVWTSQALTERLGLDEVHRLTTGAGVTVAVLDTGVDAGHPALAGRLRAGYDYVDDDSDAGDRAAGVDTHRNGVIDEAFGHGTFVAGLVSLVAPDATILPGRVLDSDGSGTVFILAEAIVDAVDAGAGVINISLGTADKTSSHVIDDALRYASKAGVIVVAAAGNAGNDQPQYPAQNRDVLSVTSLEGEADELAPFASWGGWVDLATPADRVAGPVPGGGYAWWAGTSMAAPQVAGQAALIHALDPQLKAKQSLKALTKSARKLKLKAKIKYGAVDLVGSVRLVRDGAGKAG